MKWRLISLATLLSSVMSIAACGTLFPIEKDQCGNDVIEEGEECEHIIDVNDAHTCGARDTPAECRWICIPGAKSNETPRCPEGFGCGIDGICRQPMGSLNLPEPYPIPPGFWLDHGDFDGDGIDDVAWAHGTYARVDFMENGAPVASTEVNQLQLGLPSIGDVNDDQRDDLMLPGFEGLAVLRGTELRTLKPTTFASIRFPLADPTIVAFDAIPEVLKTPSGPRYFTGDEVVALLETTNVMLLPNNHTLVPPETVVGMDDDFESILQPLVADLDERVDPALYPASSPSPEEIVVGFAGGHQVTVYRPTVNFDDPVPRLDLHTLTPVTVSTSGLSLARLLGTVHANPATTPNGPSAIPCGNDTFAVADEHLDLVLLTHMPDGPAPGLFTVELAYGVGDGQFHANPCTLDQVLQDPMAAPPSNSTAPSPLFELCADVLAVGHLDADGLLDVVTPYGIWQSRLLLIEPNETLPSLCNLFVPYYPITASTEAWTEAVTVDLNRDGIDDVVAAPDEGGLELYLSAPSGVLTWDLRPDLDTIRSLTTGDYDGDATMDVAFMETADGPDRINVLFGEALATPGEVMTVGELEDVTALATIDRRPAINELTDDAQELGVQVNDSGGVRVATLFGRPDRQLQAPFTLTYANEVDDPLTLGTVAAQVGHLIASDEEKEEREEREVALLGCCSATRTAPFITGVASAEGDLTFELLESYGTLKLSSNDISTGSMALIPRSDGDRIAFAWTPISPEQPEIVVEGARLEGTQDAATLAVAKGTITINDVALNGGLDSTLLPQWAQATTKMLEVCDVGKADGPVLLLNALRFVPCDEGEGGGIRNSLQVLDGTAIDAMFDSTSHSSQSGVATEVKLFADHERLVGFTCFNADDDSAQEVAVLGLSGAHSSCADPPGADNENLMALLWVLNYNPDANTWSSKAWSYSSNSIEALENPNPLAPPLSGFTNGDFNGDGVDDLAAGAGDGTLIWISRAKVP